MIGNSSLNAIYKTVAVELQRLLQGQLGSKIEDAIPAITEQLNAFAAKHVLVPTMKVEDVQIDTHGKVTFKVSGLEYYCDDTVYPPFAKCRDLFGVVHWAGAPALLALFWGTCCDRTGIAVDTLQRESNTTPITCVQCLAWEVKRGQRATLAGP